LLALVFGDAVELGHVVGGEPWGRLPLLAAGFLLAGAAFGAFGVLLGVLARESRTASLVAFLAAFPLVLLGLVPAGAVSAAGWISDAYPFVHAVRLFQAALYDSDPWGALAHEVAWLAGLALAFGAAARAGVRRLLT
jgi:ABC-type transport system involved in multi-copper enzyme maturation permease subunit